MKKILLIIPIIFLFVLSSCSLENSKTTTESTSINTTESQSSTLENSSITNSIEESNL